MPTAPARLKTARLVLSRPTVADAAEIFARYASDADVTRYVGWPRHTSIDDTRGFLAFADAEWARAPAGPYLIREYAGARLLGATGLMFTADDDAMTGYVLAKDAWAAGYATEAVLALVGLAPTLGLRQLHAFCHDAHRASWRVLEKAGFDRDPGAATPHEFPNLAPGVPQPTRLYRRRVDRPGT